MGKFILAILGNIQLALTKMTFSLNLGLQIGWLLATPLGEPLGDIVTILYFFSVGSLPDFLLWATTNLDRKDYEKKFKKLLERKSKKWNLTIAEDVHEVTNEFILNLKRRYLRLGMCEIWPIIYVIIAQDSWRSHRVLLGIEIICTLLLVFNTYILHKADNGIILSAMKP